jgi:hypothetical protein
MVAARISDLEFKISYLTRSKRRANETPRAREFVNASRVFSERGWQLMVDGVADLIDFGRLGRFNKAVLILP